MKVYLSGQITNLDQEVYEMLFDKAAFTAEAHGWEYVNPLKVEVCKDENCGDGAKLPDGNQLHAYGCYMKHDIKAMLDCDAILLLPNWGRSKGAQFEFEVAVKCGLEVIYLDTEYEVMS